MPSSKQLSDLAAANQLKISISVITRNQAWQRQVRGAYHFMYPWIVGDFLHLEDFGDWLKLYDKHTHGNGNNGSPTSKPLTVAPLTNAKALSYLVPTQALGKIRKGLTDALNVITELSLFNKRKL